jgi:hypothetical protein
MVVPDYSTQILAVRSNFSSSIVWLTLLQKFEFMLSSASRPAEVHAELSRLLSPELKKPNDDIMQWIQVRARV